MKASLTAHVLGSSLLKTGIIETDKIWKAFKLFPLESGKLEENFSGERSDTFFNKISELTSRLPDNTELHLILTREKVHGDILRFESTLYAFEAVKKPESFSHFQALLNELSIKSSDLKEEEWRHLLSRYFGKDLNNYRLPDFEWKQDHLKFKEEAVRVLSLTELPQLTWNGCFQKLYEYEDEFIVSLKILVPDRNKIKSQLETKRRVSHALAISSSLEVRNIESNSVLSSSEETLERILVGKETLLEISLGIILRGEEEKTLQVANELSRIGAGLGNAGVFIEELGVLPTFQSHLPAGKILNARKMSILSGNFAEIVPFLHDYSRINDDSALTLTSRTLEKSHLNLFSSENLNFNSFICGASGSGKSFLMQAILSSFSDNNPSGRICIFDVGGSYKKLISHMGGETVTLSTESAQSLISTFAKKYKIDSSGFYRTLIETLCGSGSHITHSHKVAIDSLLREREGLEFSISSMIELALSKEEKFFHDLAHWLSPHKKLDSAKSNNLVKLIENPRTAFDFKELDSEPILQRTTILVLTELLWRDLVKGNHSKTLIIFDEVWRFFAQSKSFLEEMYRTLRKYRAGIVSITQNLADYGDESFAKMLFTNSFTKLFLQNGASGEYLKSTFDLPDSDIARALAVQSKKPFYSEFFCLSPNMSQIFRLYPTPKLYSLANTENISNQN